MALLSSSLLDVLVDLKLTGKKVLGISEKKDTQSISSKTCTPSLKRVVENLRLLDSPRHSILGEPDVQYYWFEKSGLYLDSGCLAYIRF